MFKKVLLIIEQLKMIEQRCLVLDYHLNIKEKEPLHARSKEKEKKNSITCLNKLKSEKEGKDLTFSLKSSNIKNFFKSDFCLYLIKPCYWSD